MTGAEKVIERFIEGLEKPGERIPQETRPVELVTITSSKSLEKPPATIA